jgi:hypothetical protein
MGEPAQPVSLSHCAKDFHTLPLTADHSRACVNAWTESLPSPGLGQQRWPVERSNAWVLENKRLALRYDRLGFIIQSLLQAACIFLVAGRLAREL